MNRAELSKELKKICTPVFLHDDILGRNRSQNTPNGTITFIKHKDQVYYCTCKHVVEEAVKNNKSLQILAGELTQDLSTYLCKSSEKTVQYPYFKYVNDADIAIYPCPPDVYQCFSTKKGTSYIDLDAYTPPNYDTLKILHAFGWPTEHKTISGDYVKAGLADACAELASNANHDTKVFSLHSQLQTPIEFNSSGMSGGPVVSCDDNSDKYILIGIVFEGPQLSLEPQGDSFTQNNDLWIRCHNVTPTTFQEWLDNSLWAWEDNSPYMGCTPLEPTISCIQIKMSPPIT